MDGDPIDNDHRLLRYCKPTSVLNGKPDASAFARKVQHHSLSVNNVDMCSEPELKQKVARSKELIEKGQSLKANGLLALIATSDVRLVSCDPSLEVLHEPVTEAGKENPNHCGILNSPSEVDLQTGKVSILQELASHVLESWKVKDV